MLSGGKAAKGGGTPEERARFHLRDPQTGGIAGPFLFRALMFRLSLARLSLRQSTRKACPLRETALKPDARLLTPGAWRNRSSRAARLQQTKEDFDAVLAQNEQQTHTAFPHNELEEEHEYEPLEQSAPDGNDHLRDLFELAREYNQNITSKAYEAEEARPARRRPQEAQPSTFGLSRDESSNADPTSHSEYGQLRSASVRIENLPADMHQEDLQRLFSRFGEVSLVTIVTTREGRIGSVTFSSADEADRLVDSHTLTPVMFDGEPLQIRFGALTQTRAPSRTLFVQDSGDAPLDEQTLYAIFSQYGEVVAMRHALNAHAWFVDFASEEQAMAVMDQHQAMPFRNGRVLLRINYNAPNPKYEQPHHTLCIFGHTGTAADLEDFVPIFEGGNHVVKITSVPDKTGERPPLFFIEFEAVEYAARVLEMFRQSGEFPFAARYAGLPKDQRRRPRTLLPDPNEPDDMLGGSPRKNQMRPKSRPSLRPRTE